MDDKPTLCLQLWREHYEARRVLDSVHEIKMRAARDKEFPVGTKVKFRFGENWIEATVVKLPEFEWQYDKVVIRNDKSKKDREVEVQDLRLV